MANAPKCICVTPNPNQFFKAYTGLRFVIKNGTQVFVPNYKNISSLPENNYTGSQMVFKDEYTTNSLLVGGNGETIDSVTLSDLWNYANNNIKWDPLNGSLSFSDVDISEISLYDFVKSLDSFLVFSRLSKFGNVWWTAKVTSDLEGESSNNTNIVIPNTTAFSLGVSGGNSETVTFWSPDKYINDEYKKYIRDPVFYSGFLTSSDFSNGGWFSIPDLKVSTKPFEKLKIAQILLSLNFVFDPKQIGKYHTIKPAVGSRIKDETSNTILDVSETKGNQDSSIFADTVLNHWVGGLVSTENLQSLGPIGNFKPENPCSAETVSANPNAISHVISAQISLNTNTDSRSLELLNTIDPINWKSTKINQGPHKINVLNVDRAFGDASGNADDACVFGGVQKSIDDVPRVVDVLEIWSSSGFLQNVGTTANAPRCFHLQGGSNSKAAVVVGGYSSFNYTDEKQFSHYGKTDVRGDMEIFIKADAPYISYFRKVQNFQLSIPRGDGAGVLNVSSQDRKSKFDAKSALQSFPTSKENEQLVAEFIENQSGTGDAKRYTVVNAEGFYFGGSKTGSVYLTEKNNSDLTNSFEKISLIAVSVGNYTDLKSNGQCLQTVNDALTVSAANPDGTTVKLIKCGKYRIQYINGYGRYN